MLKKEINALSKGLSTKEVEQKIKENKVNIIPKTPSRTIWQIIRANLFTSFNAINAILAIIVFIAGSPKNALFAFVIIINTLVGIIQEVRAKKVLERLSVISMAHANVVRDGKIKNMEVDEIVLDDLLYLQTGDQILVDCELIQGNGLEVDESMLTGESDPILKDSKDKLLSGSFIVSGDGYGKVIKVGAETYSAKLADEAKKFKIINSELQKSINKIFKVILHIIVPLSLMLTVTQLVISKISWQEAALGTVSGAIGMIPEGLVLLTSAVFVVSIIKLSKYDILVQELSATEVLARVDVLCLDKTGTITEGKLKLSEVINIGNRSSEEINEMISGIVHFLPSKNPTQLALLDVYKDKPYINIKSDVPFSSKRKWGGITIENKGTWIMGAPEIVCKNNYDFLKKELESAAGKGYRVLLLAKAEGVTQDEIIGDVECVALILLEDLIRENAPAVLKYFKNEDVKVKIISGDNPITVAKVAERAGVFGHENYIDARNLPDDPHEFNSIINNNTVFGRVTPHQKKMIVKALQSKGHTVAMTGDGVNDVLALKESDCGIAMANGSDATKAVAQLVLMNSDFSSLPKAVAEGRKQINNLEKLAELFLSKCVSAIIISLIFSLLLQPFPLEPIQMSLVGSCAIGIPSFFLALLPNNERVKPGFLKRVLSVSIPNGIVLAILTSASFLIVNKLGGASLEHLRTVSLLMLMGVSLIILIKVSLPLNWIKSLLIIGMFILAGLSFLTETGRELFSLTTLPLNQWIISMIVIALSFPMVTFSIKSFKKFVSNKHELKRRLAHSFK